MRRWLSYLTTVWILAGVPAGAGAAFFLETVPFPAHLVPKNGSLLFSDASDTPVRKIDLQDGRVTPLVKKMGAPVGFCLQGDDLFWVETRSGSAGGCVSAQAVQILHGQFDDGLQAVELARGSNCAMGGTHEVVARGDRLYWVTSTISPDTYRIEKVSLTGAASSALYSANGNPITALAADETHLYWTEGRFPDAGVVKRLPLAGGPAETVYAASQPLFGTLAVANGWIFFGDRSFSPSAQRLLKAPAAGGQAIVLAQVSSPEPTITRIVLDGDQVLWCDLHEIYRTPAEGGTTGVVAGGLPLPPVAIAAAGGRVYWSEHTGSAHGQTGMVKSVPLAGGKIQIHVQGGDAPFQIAVRNDWLYWSEGGDIGTLEGFGRIARVPLTGGRATTLAAGVSGTRPPIAVDDTHVYIADGCRLKKAPLHGGPPETVAAADFAIKDLDVDGGVLYWIEEPFAAVKKIGVDGGPVMLLATGSGPAGPLRLSGGMIYWMEGGDTLKRIPASGGSAEILASGLPDLDDFRVAGADLYFAERDTGAVQKMPAGGGTPAPLGILPPGSSPRRLALDGTFLYWIDRHAAGRIPRAGGAAETLAQNLDTDPYTPNAIAADGAGRYWCETGSGRISTTRVFSGSSAAYFPLNPGTSWTFQQDASSDLTYTVLAQTETVNGVPTRVIQRSDGYRQHFTNDAGGIRLHREYEPAVDLGDGVLRSATFTFLTPLVYAGPVMTLGQTVSSSGAVQLVFSGLGTYNLSYSAQSTMEGFETLDLPLGRFKTGRACIAVRFYGTIEGQPLDETITNVNWLARGIGLVRWAESDGVTTDAGRISATSIPLADLSVFQTAAPLPLRLGQEFTYRIRVANNGPGAAGDVVLTDILPPDLTLVCASAGCTSSGTSVTCNAGTLARGAAFTATLAFTATRTGILENTLSAQGTETDPSPDDNTASRRDAVPADRDGDGIPDAVELSGCSDPDLADTDGDGLPDGLEDGNANGRLDPGETSPCAADSDGDGLPDPWEIETGTYPMIRDDGDDPDGDGFTNLDEFISGTDPGNENSRPLADVDGDRRTTLADAIRILQSLTAASGGTPIRPDYATCGTDINGDGRAGLAEAGYVLRTLAKLRL